MTLHDQNRRCVAQFAKSLKSWWCCIKNASAHKVTPSVLILHGSSKWRIHFLSSKPPIRKKRSMTPRPIWNDHFPWTVWCVAMSVSAKLKSQYVPHLKPSKTACRSQYWCPRHCWHHNMATPFQIALRATPFVSKSCRVFSPTLKQQKSLRVLSQAKSTV